MKIIAIILLTFISPLLISAQGIVNKDGNVDVPGKPGDNILEKKYIPKNIGSQLLFERYYQGSIYFKEKAQVNNVNIDLEKNLILFEAKGNLMQLDFHEVDSVTFENFKIIFNLGDLHGCLLVYDVGPHNLINSKKAALKESDYNKSLDVGSRDNKWIITDDFYLEKYSNAYYEKDYGVIELPSSKKKFSALFLNSDVVLHYIKENKVKLDEVEDLVTLFHKYSADLR